MAERKDVKEETGDEIQKIIQRLRDCDEKKDTGNKTRDRLTESLVAIGKPATPALIELLRNQKARMSRVAGINVLGRTGDTRAIEPLADILEDPELGEHAGDALKEFGSACIGAVIKRIECRINHPVKKGTSVDMITSQALSVIAEIHCDQSSHFLNNLLDGYISEMPDEPFDPTEHEWKYRNISFFHLLDCMVRQQNISAIPHIRKAKHRFPEEYTDYTICQIAIGRLKKGKVEGYLPMEALEIAMPSGMIMDVLSRGQYGWQDRFHEEYGEYLEEDEA